MVTFKLIKNSGAGWEKIFNSEIEARNELYKWICNLCKEEDTIKANSSIDDMLCTACGCEFWYEIVDPSE
jgi:hypothetical protein